MADTEKLIKIIFEGVDKTTGTMGKIGSGMENLGKSFVDVAGPVASLGDSILTVDKYLAALATGGLVLSSMKAIEYKDAIADLNKVMGEGETLTDDMKKQQKNLASTYGIATAEIIQSQAGLQQSGYNAADSLLVLETSAQLAASSELSAAEATDLLKKSMIGYEVGAEKALEIADLWNLTANKSSTDVRKLGEGFAIVGRQAKNAGFTMEELTASLTPIIGVFGSGSEAGNAMSITISSLNNPTSKATAAINKLLGTSGPLNKSFSSTADTFKAISSAFRTLPAAQKDSITALIVGKDQAKRATLAFTDFEKELKKVDAASREIGKSLKDEVKIALELTSIQVDILKVKFNDFFTSIGLQYDKELSDMLSGVSGVFGGFEIAVNDDAFKPLFDLIRGTGAEISTLLEQIAKNLPEALKGVDFKGIADSLDSLKKNIFSIFDDTDLSTTSGLTEAIKLVVDSIDTLVKLTDGILSAWQPFFDAVGVGVDYLNNMDDATKDLVGNLMGAAQQFVLFGGVIAGLGLVLKGVGAGFGVFGDIAKFTATKMGLLDKAAKTTSTSILKFHEQSGLLSATQKIKRLALAMVGPGGLHLAALAVGVAIGTLINAIPGVEEAVQKTIAKIGKIFGKNKDWKFEFSESETDIKNKFEGYEKYLANIQAAKDKLSADKIRLEFIDLSKLEAKMHAVIKQQQDGLRFKLRMEVEKEQIKGEIDETLKTVNQKLIDNEEFLKLGIEFELDDKSKESIKEIDDINQKLFDLSERKNEIQVIAEFNTKAGKVTPNELALEFQSISEKINNLTSEKKSIQVELEDNDSFQKISKAQKSVDELTEEKRILNLQTEVNEGKGLGEVVSELSRIQTADGKGYYRIELQPGLEGGAEKEVKKAIDVLSEDRKILLKFETAKMENETKRIVAQVEASSKIIEKAMDYEFQLDIKQAEIDLEKVTQAFESTKEVLIAVTQASADMFGAFSTDFDTRTLWLFQEQLRQNLDIQREQADQQTKLNEAILEELRLKNLLREKFINGDDALLKVSVDDSLEADLAAFVRALIPRLQVWGSENDVSLLIEATT